MSCFGVVTATLATPLFTEVEEEAVLEDLAIATALDSGSLTFGGGVTVLVFVSVTHGVAATADFLVLVGAVTWVLALSGTRGFEVGALEEVTVACLLIGLIGALCC